MKNLNLNMNIINSYNHPTAGYSVAAQAVFALMNTDPPTALKNAMATFIDKQVVNGNWAKLGMFQFRGMDTLANARLNWMSSSFNGEASLITGITHVANQYFAYSGTQARGYDLGYNPTNDPKWGLRDAIVGGYILQNNATRDQDAIIGSNGLVMQQRTVASRLDFLSINGITAATAGTFPTGFVGRRMYAARSIPFGASQVTTQAIENGTIIATRNDNTVAKTNVTLYEGARHNAAMQLNGRMAMVFAGSGDGFDYANFRIDFEAMLTTLGI